MWDLLEGIWEWSWIPKTQCRASQSVSILWTSVTFGQSTIKDHIGRKHLELTPKETENGQSIWIKNKVKSEPNEGSKFSCNTCKVDFIALQSYNFHMKLVHDVKPKKIHTCELCNKSYNFRTNYNRHVKATHLKRRFNCEKCHQKFTTKQMLYLHVKVKHEEFTFDCEICHKPLTSKAGLEKHIKSCLSSTYFFLII